jgi:hypothetical protein
MLLVLESRPCLQPEPGRQLPASPKHSQLVQFALPQQRLESLTRQGQESVKHLSPSALQPLLAMNQELSVFQDAKAKSKQCKSRQRSQPSSVSGA